MTKAENKTTTLEAMAKEYGLEQYELIQSTIARYKNEMAILDKLQDAIDSMEVTVEKEYIKGRVNIVINPAISEYAKHTSVANNTATTLTKIINDLTSKKTEKEKKELSSNPLENLLSD